MVGWFLSGSACLILSSRGLRPTPRWQVARLFHSVYVLFIYNSVTGAIVERAAVRVRGYEELIFCSAW